MNISKNLFFASSDRGLECGNSSRNSFFHTAFLKIFIFCLFILFIPAITKAQSETDPKAIEFKKTLHDRSVKIVIGVLKAIIERSTVNCTGKGLLLEDAATSANLLPESRDRCY